MLDGGSINREWEMSLTNYNLSTGEILAFVSHHHEDANSEARLLQSELCKHLGVGPSLVVFSSDVAQELDSLLQNVKKSKVLVLLLTKQPNLHPFTLAELYTALITGIEVLAIELEGPGFAIREMTELLRASDFAQRLEKQNPGIVGQLEHHHIDVPKMIQVLSERIPLLPVERFDTSWSIRVRQTGLEVIAERISHLANLAPSRNVSAVQPKGADTTIAMRDRLLGRGIPLEDANTYSPRLLQEGFTAENIIMLARPHILYRAGIIKPAHVRALLSDQALRDFDANEEVKFITEYREELNRKERELREARQKAEAAIKTAAEDRKALENALLRKETEKVVESDFLVAVEVFTEHDGHTPAPISHVAMSRNLTSTGPPVPRTAITRQSSSDKPQFRTLWGTPMINLNERFGLVCGSCLGMTMHALWPGLHGVAMGVCGVCFEACAMACCSKSSRIWYKDELGQRIFWSEIVCYSNWSSELEAYNRDLSGSQKVIQTCGYYFYWDSSACCC